ncbi:MAG: hypothetical protein SGCHY_000207 [Lobulomycetales sp.]
MEVENHWIPPTTETVSTETGWLYEILMSASSFDSSFDEEKVVSTPFTPLKDDSISSIELGTSTGSDISSSSEFAPFPTPRKQPPQEVPNMAEAEEFRKMQLPIPPLQPNIQGTPGVWDSLSAIASYSMMNLMLLFVPLGIVAHYFFQRDPSNSISLMSFSSNLLALAPLTGLLNFATDEMFLEAGGRKCHPLGILLRSIFSNSPQLVVLFLSLLSGMPGLAQYTLMGIFAYNLLLTFGFCFFVAGARLNISEYSQMVPRGQSWILLVCTVILLAPTTTAGIIDSAIILTVSRVLAFVLLAIFLLYVFMARCRHQYSLMHYEEDVIQDDYERSLNLPISMLLFAVCMILISFHADYLIESTPAAIRASFLTEGLVGFVLIPGGINSMVYLASVSEAFQGNMTRSTSCILHKTIELALFLAPASVVMGLALGVGMSFAFPLVGAVTTLTAVLFIALLFVIGQGASMFSGILLMLLYLLSSIFLWLL